MLNQRLINSCFIDVALPATNINEPSFVANWNPIVVNGKTAIYYELTVSKNSDFLTPLLNYSNVRCYATSQIVFNLDENTVYYYKVRAFLIDGTYSDDSNIVEVFTGATKIYTPKNLRIHPTIPFISGNIIFTLDQIPDYTGYITVERSTTPDFAVIREAVTLNNSAEMYITFPGLDNRFGFEYYIRAYVAADNPIYAYLQGYTPSVAYPTDQDYFGFYDGDTIDYYRYNGKDGLHDANRHVAIPDTINSRKVTSISEMKDSENLISIQVLGQYCVLVERLKFNSAMLSAYLSDWVEEIGASCFLGNCRMTYLRLSNSLTSLPQHMCEGCESLTSIVIPESITSLGLSCFGDCPLTDITIGANVTWTEEDENVFGLHTVQFIAEYTAHSYAAGRYLYDPENGVWVKQ